MEDSEPLVNLTACDLLKSAPPIETEATHVVQLTAEAQKEILIMRTIQCYCRIESEPAKLTGTFCGRLWDTVSCWDDTPAGVTARQPCPAYINSFNTQQHATRLCLSNGTWAPNPSLNGSSLTGWTNYTACLIANESPSSSISHDVPDLFIKHMNEFRIMYNVGYGLSLVTLVFAFIIMTYFRKLHCSRNTIHLNLFGAFICRAAMSLLRDNLMVNGIGFARDVEYNDSGGGFFFTDGPHWECRLFFSVFQYALTASYFWIFIEAVYLHVLIFVTIFSRRVKVGWYALIGWGVPLIIVITWSLCRYYFNNTLCWNLNINQPGLIWIINGPIMLTVLISCIFFVRLVRVLYTKLQESPCPEGKRHKYRRLARSTMFLVPVFGVHYIIFAVPTHGLNDTVAFVMLFIEMFFNSYQGFFIALVLCFINGEVRMEVRKAWCRRTLRRGSEPMSRTRLSRSQNDRKCSVIRNGTTHDLELGQLDESEKRGASEDFLRKRSEELPFLKADSITEMKPMERQHPKSYECFAISETRRDSLKLEVTGNEKSTLLLSKNNNIVDDNGAVLRCNMDVQDSHTVGPERLTTV